MYMHYIHLPAMRHNKLVSMSVEFALKNSRKRYKTRKDVVKNPITRMSKCHHITVISPLPWWGGQDGFSWSSSQREAIIVILYRHLTSSLLVVGRSLEDLPISLMSYIDYWQAEDAFMAGLPCWSKPNNQHHTHHRHVASVYHPRC